MKRIAVLLLLLSAPLLATTPLNDLGPAPYCCGYVGGLWDEGSNLIPADHLAAGMKQAALIRPLDENGQPSPSGKIVLLTVGFDETKRIADAFAAMAANDRRVNRDSLVLANAARSGIDVTAWQLTTQPIWSWIDSYVLLPAGVTAQQVQAAWIEMVDNGPILSMPPPSADAYRLKAYESQVVRTLKVMYPNLRVAYLSSRVFGGYATTGWNPEPYAYESGLTVRWIVVGQVIEVRTEQPYWDTRVGDINYEHGIAPWVSWGPYLWADGTNPRSDGLTWERDDFNADGETLSEKGAQKGGRLLFDFFLHEPTASSWFLSGITPMRTRVAHH